MIIRMMNPQLVQNATFISTDYTFPFSSCTISAADRFILGCTSNSKFISTGNAIETSSLRVISRLTLWNPLIAAEGSLPSCWGSLGQAALLVAYTEGILIPKQISLLRPASLVISQCIWMGLWGALGNMQAAGEGGWGNLKLSPVIEDCDRGKIHRWSKCIPESEGSFPFWAGNIL